MDITSQKINDGTLSKEFLESCMKGVRKSDSSVNVNPDEELKVWKEHIERLRQKIENSDDADDFKLISGENSNAGFIDPWVKRIEDKPVDKSSSEEFLDVNRKEKCDPAPKENPNEEPKLRNQHLENFRKKLESENIRCRKDDMFLLSFLRTYKFDQKRAYNGLMKYYETKKSYPELFSDFTPMAYRQILESGMYKILPKPDRLGRVIYLFRNELEGEPPVSFREFISGSVLTLEYALQREDVQKNGMVAVYDAKYLRWGFLLEMTPRMISAAVSSVIGAFPIRYKEIHYVNTNRIFQVLFYLLKPFLPKKFIERIRFHGYSWESVHKHVGKHLFPRDVGGTLEDDKHKEFIKGMLEQEENFQEYQQYWRPPVRETIL